MSVTFSSPGWLWLLLLLPPLLWLAWRARPRRRTVAGSLTLWRLALERRPPAARSRWRRPEVLLTALAAAGGVLAVAGPETGRSVPARARVLYDRNCRLRAWGDAGADAWTAEVRRRYPGAVRVDGDFSGNPRELELARRDDLPSRPGERPPVRFWVSDRPPAADLDALWLPVGKSGPNLALCRARSLGGAGAVTVANYTAAPWSGRLVWSAPGVSGEQPLTLAPGEVRAVLAEIPPDAWKAAGGRVRLGLEGVPADDLIAADNAAEVRKCLTVAMDAGRFPALARAFRACGLEIIAPGAPADVAVIAAGAAAPGNARRAVLEVSPANPAGETPPAMTPEAIAACGPADPCPRWRCPPLAPSWTGSDAFPLAVCHWLDGLFPAAEDCDPGSHDCRAPLPRHPDIAWPAPLTVSAGVSLAPGAAGLAAAAALGLAVLALRRKGR